MRRRLLLSYLTITILVLVGLEVPLGFSYARSEHRRLEESVHEDAVTLAIRSEEALEEPPEPGSQAELAGLAARYRNESDDRILVVDRHGRPVVSSRAGRRAARGEPRQLRAARDRGRAPRSREQREPLLARAGRRDLVLGGPRRVGQLGGRRGPRQPVAGRGGPPRRGELAAPRHHRRRGSRRRLAGQLLRRPLGDQTPRRRQSRRGGPRSRCPRVSVARAPRPGRGSGPRPGVQHHREPTRGAGRRAAGLRRRRLASAPHPARRAAAPTREPRERGRTGGRRRRRRSTGRGRTAHPPRRRAHDPRPGRAGCVSTGRRRRRRRRGRPARRVGRLRRGAGRGRHR